MHKRTAVFYEETQGESKRARIGCLYPPPTDWSVPHTVFSVRPLLPTGRIDNADVFAMRRWQFQPPEHDRVQTIKVRAVAIMCTCALWERSYPLCYEIMPQDEPAIMAHVSHYDEVQEQLM